MSDDIDESSVPDRDTCDRLIEEFVVVTQTDSACAQFFLQDHEWDLSRSLDGYYDVKKKQERQKEQDELEDDEEIQVLMERSQQATDNSMSTNSDPQSPKKLKLISWNIDGLDDTYLKQRVKFICRLVDSEQPDIIFFQEVIPTSLGLIEKYLPQYKVHVGGEVHYFTVTLTKREVIECGELRIIPFPSTSMERNLLVLEIKFADIPLLLINSHLESTGKKSVERIKQMRSAFKFALEVPEDRTVIFGGDLNMRDKELEQCGGIPPGLEDLWISCGSRSECQYTWDMDRNDNLTFAGRFKPRLRFDRLYLRQATPPRLTAEHFGLIGLERLKSCRRFPSDHWGLITYFRLDG